MEQTYRAFGTYPIASELPCQGYPPLAEGTPEVLIRRGAVPEWNGDADDLRYGDRCQDSTARNGWCGLKPCRFRRA